MPLPRRRLPAHRRLQSRRLGSHFEKLEERRVFAAVALDPSFGEAGFVTDSFLAKTPEGDLYDSADAISDVVRQADGKILAAGTSHNGFIDSNARYDFILARYNVDGSLDADFGDQGVVRTDFGQFDYGSNIALQPDGKIVMVGEVIGPYGGFDMAVSRYLPDGTLDATFGGDGKVTVDFLGLEEGRAVAVQPDGAILVAGATLANSRYAFAVARLRPDGTLDASFGDDGKAVVWFGDGSASVSSLVLQSDGAIVLGGKASPQPSYPGSNAGYDFALARLLPDGNLDTTFGDQGLVTTDVSGSTDAVDRLLLAGDDTLLAVGFASGPGTGVARYHADGSLDTAFSGDGKTLVSGVGGLDDAALQEDGRLLMLGSWFRNEIRMVRLHTNGQIDTTLDNTGAYITTYPEHIAGQAGTLYLSPEGEAIVAGTATTDVNRDFTLAKFLVDVAPLSFRLSSGQFELTEDAPLQIVSGFAENLSSGDLSFEVENTRPELFGVAPSIDSTGTLSYQLAANAYGTGEISVRGITTTGEITPAQTFTVKVSSVNDAPIFGESFAPTLRASPEDVRQSEGTFVWELLSGVTDADDGALSGIAVPSADVTHGQWEFKLAGDDYWLPLVPPPSFPARLVPSDARVRFVPDENFNGQSTFEFYAWDQTQGIPGGLLGTELNRGGSKSLSPDKAAATITVTPVNDAPVLDSEVVTWWPKIVEDTATPPERRVSTLLWGASDVDEAAQRGIAVTAARNYWGTWEYKLNGSDTWQAMSHAAETSAVLLPDDALIRYTPKANDNRGATLYFRAWDQTAGTAGGTMDLTGQKGGAKSVSLALDSVWLNVTPVNDAPVLDVSFNPTLPTIQEDSQEVVTTRVEDLIRGAIHDVDDGALQGIAVVGASSYNGDWLYYSEEFGRWSWMSADHSMATMLTPSTLLRFVPKPDFHGEVKLYYRAWDQTGRRPDSRYNSGGSKHMSTEVEVATLKVLPDSDPPRLQVSGTVAYQRGAYQFQLAPYANLRDADTFQFNGARLTVHTTTGADAGNKLFLGAHFSVDDQQQVLKEGKVIGRLTSNGHGLNHMEIRFNANANQAIVQEVVRMVMFQTEPTAKIGKRVLKFSFADADGEPTLTAWKTVNVS